MIISIDAASGLAIYDQIVRQIKFAIASEVLLPGELIPSVREMAKQTAVNPNTVSRAYRELQSEGILDIVRGTGLQVTTGAVRKCRKDRQGLIQERLRAVLKEAQQSQLEVDEIRQLIDSELARLNGKGTAE
ncbi:MAG: GntR family transcriptional regulator [Planctomycetaceae bacterium]|jgi:GntR family transcriptional regulator|nr:GntR family transcriptional regulator [Planctomycetaceae bacterium]